MKQVIEVSTMILVVVLAVIVLYRKAVYNEDPNTFVLFVFLLNLANSNSKDDKD